MRTAEGHSIIAQHATRNSFGIAIIATGTDYSVTRYGKISGIGERYITLSRHADEKAARAAANREWLADKGVA